MWLEGHHSQALAATTACSHALGCGLDWVPITQASVCVAAGNKSRCTVRSTVHGDTHVNRRKMWLGSVFAAQANGSNAQCQHVLAHRRCTQCPRRAAPRPWISIDPNDVVYSVHMNTHAARECSHHAVDNMGEHEKPGRAAPALQSQLAADAQ